MGEKWFDVHWLETFWLAVYDVFYSNATSTQAEMPVSLTATIDDNQFSLLLATCCLLLATC